MGEPNMKIGAWIHGGDDITLDSQIRTAAEMGINAVRCYDIGNSEFIVPVLKETKMSLLAGMHIDAPALLENWRSQVRLDELARYYELGVPLDAICVGNELREGGDHPKNKRFSARLSFALANVLSEYRQWLDSHGFDTPLTYASEGIVVEPEGWFSEWMWPLIDASGAVSVNLYPMDEAAWFTFGAFEESRKLLQDTRERHLRFTLFELFLRRVMQQLARVGKPLILSETGFPSAVGYHMENENRVIPISDDENFAKAMTEYMAIIRRVNRDYDGQIKSLYFYEWRDNLHHGAIWNPEVQSPVHTSFGLCDRTGKPKLDIRSLVAQAEGE
jgi:hypothetical protein